MKEYIKERLLEFILGVGVFAVAIFFMMYAFAQIDDLGSVKNTVYSMKFSTISSLMEGDKVKIGGVQIGKVVKISVDKKTYYPIVKVVIWGDLSLPKDSEVRILSLSLLGGKYIDISPGASKELLEPLDEFTKTVDAMSLEDIISRSLFIVQQNAQRVIEK